MFIRDLKAAFEAHADAENAFHMEAYMRNKFQFYGIKAGLRRELFREAIAENKQEVITDCRTIVRKMYKMPYREMHLCAMELLFRVHKKTLVPDDLDLITFLITTHSWWDTVDYIAKNLLGEYLRSYPGKIETVVEDYSDSGNLWLIRSTILFQLGFKKDTDAELLFRQCVRFSESGEFFIQKAIGWSLREYAKIAPEAVLNFVNSHTLKPLSQREAIRNL